MSSEVAELDRDADGLPDSWRRVRLGQVFTERKEKGRTGLPVASVSIEYGLVLRSSLDRRVSSELPPEGHALVRKGDIAYNMMRMWQGACGLAEADCIISPAYVVMTPRADVEPLFAHVALRSEPMITLLHGYSQGIVDDRLRLYPDAFAQVPINLPPLDEQRRIAEVLRSVDDAIASAEDVASQAREAFEALLADLFALYGDASAKLGSYCVKGGLQTGPFGSQLKAEDYVKEGVPIIMPVDLTPEGMDFEGAKKAPTGKASELARHILQPGDVLFARRGEIGRCGLYLEGDPVALCGTGCLRARLDTSKIDPALAYFLIQSRQARDWLCVHAVGATMPNLNTTIIGDLPMPDIPLHEQAAWVDALLMLEGTQRINQRVLLSHKMTKAALMSDLLSGRVRVPA